jgi:lysophospholipase L1-like esterase
VTRVASATKDYADAACEVGAKLNLPVVNLWRAFMEKAGLKVDAWALGDPIPGSLGVPQNDALVELMYDGMEAGLRQTSSSLTDYTGLHLNPAGYEIFFQELMKVIAERWPDQLPDKLPMVLPAWNDAEGWRVWKSALQ